MPTRRSALKQMAATSAAVVAQTASTLTRRSHAHNPGAELLRTRHKAAHRKRPLILIYLWNFHYIPAGSIGYGRPAPEQYKKHLPEIADPQRLRYLDKSFAVSSRVWEQYQRASAPAPLPLTLGQQAGDGPRSVPVRIGDDIPGAQRNGTLAKVSLTLKADGAVVDDVLSVKFNGAAAQATAGAGGDWLDLPLPPRAVKQGVNQLQLSIARRGDSADKEIIIDQVRVDVRYRQE